MTEVRVQAGNGADEESGESISEGWVEHPFTEHMARTAQENARKCLERLISGAKGSADPKVVALVCEYQAAKQSWELFSGKWRR